MKNFFTGTRFKITVSIFAALLFGVFFAAVSDNGSSPVSSVISYITTPLQNIASDTVDMLDNFNGHFVSSQKYKEENQSLKNEINELRSQLVDYEKCKYKLEAYEDFLEIKEENPDFTFAPAQVIMRDSSDIYGSFTLNKGSADGISVNSPVIYSDVLIGVVKSVNQNNCTVYTLLNPSISVSAYDIRTRENCYTESEFSLSQEGVLKLSGLKKNTPVVSGGLVCTSGIGGIYPKDLIIGSVTEIKTDEMGLGAIALVTPEIDYSLLTDVFIITDFEGKTE